MTKIDLQVIGSLTNEESAISQLNQNVSEIEVKSDTFLSRSGTGTPNHMTRNLDMNDKRVMNLPTPVHELEPLRLKDLADFKGSGQVFPVSTLPTGGATGKVLTKASGSDFDTTWGPGTAGLPFVFISDFGVVGDGSTDDTTALNAAFASLAGAGGTVVFDRPGFCKVTSTILVGSTTDQTNVNIFCPYGPIRSGIKWFGATNGIAMLFSKQKFVRCSGLGIFNQVARGTTVGLGLGGPGGGNQTSGVIIDGLFVSGFNLGVHAGSSGGAASEVAFNLPIFQSCDTGFAATDFNSLDFTFICPGFDACGIGLDTSAATGFDVFGGSASFSSIADFKIGLNSQQTYIGGGFRSEVATAFVSGAGGNVVIDRVLVVSPPSPFNSITGNFGSLVVTNSTIDGYIALSGGGVNEILEVTGNRLLRWDTTTKLPVLMSISEPALRARCLFCNNTDYGAFPPRQILDQQGMFGLKQQDFPAPPTVLYEPCISVIPIDKASTTDIGVSYLALNHVRHLSEGSFPGSSAGTAPTSGKNLRVRGTFASSPTLAFPFVRTNVVVTCNATDLLTATTGTFTQADVGKKLKITTGADTGADWYGYIVDFLSPTTVNILASSDSTPGGRYPQGSGKATVIGENEPDANYMVVGLVGSANETFWIDHSTIATTGFSFKSSNATSTATVTALIVR
jgi:hypothetical protein